MTRTATAQLAGLAAAYLLGALAVPAAIPLGVAMLSIALPVALRELGVLADHDELQRTAQRAGATWAFLLILAMAPAYPVVGVVREEFAGRTLEAAIGVYALVYLMRSRGAAAAARTLLLIAGGLAVVYGASRLPDVDKLVAMAVVGMALAAVGLLAGRWPRLAGLVVAGVWSLRVVPTVRAGGPEVAVMVPTTLLMLALAGGLLRAGGRAPATDAAAGTASG